MVNEKLKLIDEYNRKISDQITYTIGFVRIVHLEYINEYYRAAKKSLIYLECTLNENGIGTYKYNAAISSLNEIRKALIVGMFHLWLHNLQELLTMGENEFHINKSKFMNWGFDRISSIFKDKIDNNLIDIIRKYAVLTNTIKHGLGKSFSDLQQNYPEFFYPSKEYSKIDMNGYLCEFSNPPLVSKEHFEELYSTLIKFWEIIPDKITIDVKWLK